MKDGLSDSRINVIVQDHHGFMWFATQNGLNRYDGNGFMIFKTETGNPKSLSGNAITGLIVDEKEDILWVGTRNGLSTINIKTLNIKRIDLGGNNVIRTINEGRDSILWLGTHSGVIKFNKKSGDYKIYNSENSGLSNNKVRAVHKDNDGNLWVGTFDKLNKLVHDSCRFQIIDLKRDFGGSSIDNNLILSILPYGQNNDSLLWVGTQTGLYIYNRYSGDHIAFYGKSSAHLSNEVIKTLHRSDSNNLWIGTDFGLTCLHPAWDSSDLYYHDIHDQYSLINNVVWYL